MRLGPVRGRAPGRAAGAVPPRRGAQQPVMFLLWGVFVLAVVLVTAGAAVAAASERHWVVVFLSAAVALVWLAEFVRWWL
jgi:hypothetical protein